MSDSFPTDLIQPCLLDRLCDDQPDVPGEGRNERVISMNRFREGVLRDLHWLLNTSSHLETEEFGEFPEVMDSVINFGIRDVSGLVQSEVDLFSFRKHIESRLRVFEPRLNPDKLKVTFIGPRGSHAQEATLRFEISGELWARPMPESFYAFTDIDLESGHLQLKRG